MEKIIKTREILQDTISLLNLISVTGGVYSNEDLVRMEERLQQADLLLASLDEDFLIDKFFEEEVEEAAPAAVYQPMPVKGYTTATSGTVDEVNLNKMVEEVVLNRLDDLKEMDVDQRWLATGRTDIEKGFMAVNRALFKPQRASIDWPKLLNELPVSLPASAK